VRVRAIRRRTIRMTIVAAIVEFAFILIPILLLTWLNSDGSEET